MLPPACNRLKTSLPRQSHQLELKDCFLMIKATIFFFKNHDVAVDCKVPGMYSFKVTGRWRGYASTFLISAQGITLMPIGLHRHV